MKIYGDEELTKAQIDAGLSSMNGPKGQFGAKKVRAALSRIGVSKSGEGADVLIGRELRLRHIRRLKRTIDERIED